MTPTKFLDLLSPEQQKDFFNMDNDEVRQYLLGKLDLIVDHLTYWSQYNQDNGYKIVNDFSMVLLVKLSE